MSAAKSLLLFAIGMNFAIAASAQQSVPASATVNATPAATSTPVTTTTTGVNGYLPVFTGASTVVNSIVYQTPNGIGIGRTPNAMLDVNGKSIFRGGQVLSRTGDATASAPAPSFGLIMQSSVYNSSKAQNLLPYFQLQTEPTGNNTANTNATFNFLYYSGVGANASETGLYFNPNGVIHFAPAQTFPITTGATGPAGPAGPKGATGPVGPTGATGPAGPAGGLSLPFSAEGSNGYAALFNVYNDAAKGIGIEGAGGNTSENPLGEPQPSGAGIVGYGGPAVEVGGGGVSIRGAAGLYAVGGGSSGDPNTQTFGGIGVVGYGGNQNASTDVGGSGGFFLGGGSQGTGIVAIAGGYPSGGDAGIFDGDVEVNGNLSKSGGSFKIDDPIDPGNKYLYHSFVESPDMMNIYNGNVVTDGQGEAVVTMPDYFEVLNRDFRYQLTVIGQFAQAIVGSKISGNAFVIKTDRPRVEVSWQVTGVRQDAWANAHRIPNEVEKSAAEKGHFIHPELFGHPEDTGIGSINHSKLLTARQ